MEINDIRSTVPLNNGVQMPCLGFGTYKLPEAHRSDLISQAIRMGYRSIDTAAMYNNEEAVGAGVRNSGVAREELFITTKLWNDCQGYDLTLRAFDESLKRLNLDYLDLYLIHWPKPLSSDSWRAMEKLYEEKRVRAIGLSNFNPHHIDELLKTAKIPPVINQIELSPQFRQFEVVDYCRAHQILPVAWSPLIRGKALALAQIKDIARKHNKSCAQIVLRWDMQLGFPTIPKASTPERIAENMQLFDFELDQEDLKQIDELNVNIRSDHDPDVVYFE